MSSIGGQTGVSSPIAELATDTDALDDRLPVQRMTEGATCARGDLRVRTAGNARVIAHVGLRTTPEVSGVTHGSPPACPPGRVALPSVDYLGRCLPVTTDVHSSRVTHR